MTHPRRPKRIPPVDPTTLSPADHATILLVVDEMRIDAGTGGQCGFVAEVLCLKYGWDIYGGIYHSLDGLPIGDHVWNYDPTTGAIIDATADQFGEGDEIRILLPGDPAAARYRFADSDEQETEWLDAARATSDTQGDYWWIENGDQNPNALTYAQRVTGYERGIDRHGVVHP